MNWARVSHLMLVVGGPPSDWNSQSVKSDDNERDSSTAVDSIGNPSSIQTRIQTTESGFKPAKPTILMSDARG